mgnify:CR=1 FL=1
MKCFFQAIDGIRDAQEYRGLGDEYKRQAYNIFDVDGNGNPVGLSTFWNTLQPSSGNQTVRIVLRHELDKDATGIAIDDFAGSGGETDIDVIFNLTVTN